MLIRSFFRKKTTKIYIIILSILLSSIFILYNFVNYFREVEENIIAEHSILIVSSNNDYYDYLQKIKNVTKIEKAIVFTPDKSYDIIVDGSYTIQDSNGNIINSYISKYDGEYKITWNELLTSDFDDYILVRNQEQRNMNLKSDEISIVLRVPFYEDGKESYNFQQYRNQKIGFKFLDETIEFSISDFYPSKWTEWPELVISNDKFEQLYQKSKLYTYSINFDSYDEAVSIKNKLSNIDNNSNSKFIIDTFYHHGEGMKLSNISDILSVLKMAICLVSLIFLIVYIIIIKNTISDLKRNVKISRLVGYNMIQIRKRVIILLILLFFVTFLLFVLINIFFNIFVKYFFSFKINSLDVMKLILLFIIGIFINFICGITTKKIICK